MEQSKLARINALAKKAKQDGLTDAEKTEQQALREEYIKAYRANLKAQLDNTVVLHPDGSAMRLRSKKSK